MFFDSPWLRSSGIVLSAFSLSIGIAACGSSGNSAPSASLPSTDPNGVSPVPTPIPPATPAPSQKPAIQAAAPVASPSQSPQSSGDRSTSSNVTDLEIVGATEDEGFNIFYIGATSKRCVDPSETAADCVKDWAIEYKIANNRLTAMVDCNAKTIGNVAFEDGGYVKGMSEPVGEGMKNLVTRACRSLMYLEESVEQSKAVPDEPTGEPGYVGYDVIGTTGNGTEVRFISSQMACEAGATPPNCDRHEVNLVIGEANSSAVVFCSTGNFNELTIDGVLVRYLMQPKTGAYAQVVDRVCSE